MDKAKIAQELKKLDFEYEIVTEYNKMIYEAYVNAGYFSSPTSNFCYDVEQVKENMKDVDENKKKQLNASNIKALIVRYDKFISLLE